jgi:hypothetical protein
MVAAAPRRDTNVIVNDYNTPVQIEHYILQPRTLGIGFDFTY